MDKLSREEMAYEDALDLIEASLRGEVVSLTALSTAIGLLRDAFAMNFANKLAAFKPNSSWSESFEDEEREK